MFLHSLLYSSCTVRRCVVRTTIHVRRYPDIDMCSCSIQEQYAYRRAQVYDCSKHRSIPTRPLDPPHYATLSESMSESRSNTKHHVNHAHPLIHMLWHMPGLQQCSRPPLLRVFLGNYDWLPW